MTVRLAIAVGDPAGVGPAVSVEAVASAAGEAHAWVFGDGARLARAFAERGLDVPLVSSLAEAERCTQPIVVVDVGEVGDDAIRRHAPNAEAGAHALRTLDAAVDAVVAGHARAVVTGPVSKEAIVEAGHPFVGQTEHLARRAGLADDDVSMLFLGPKLRVGLVTTHLSVREAPDAITAPRVERTVRHLGEALVRLFPGQPIRLDVAGLNPHAGEGGLFGDEEIRVVGPVCARLRQAPPFDGHPVFLVGPRAAEASFREAASGLVHGVVAMMHDQATIASKLLDWGSAVNVTWGLPFLRTSVDHGVAFDAARVGSADADGMIAALAMARRLLGAT